jgi:hypothetical protein
MAAMEFQRGRQDMNTKKLALFGASAVVLAGVLVYALGIYPPASGRDGRGAIGQRDVYHAAQPADASVNPDNAPVAATADQLKDEQVVTLQDGQMFQLSNGLRYQIQNGQMVALRDGMIYRMSDGQMVQFRNGMLYQMQNGRMMHELNSGQMLAIKNGQIVALQNGMRFQMTNGQMLALKNEMRNQMQNGMARY